MNEETPFRGGRGQAASALGGAITDSLFGGLLKPSLLECGGPIETVSNLPGYARFRISGIRGNESAEAIIVENLRRLPGVQSVEVTRITGSVLIRYEPDQLSPELLLVALLKILDLEDRFLETPRPVLIRELAELGDIANRTVYHMSGGLIDLWTALFTALAALGISRVAQNGLNALPGGMTLLWWAGTLLFRLRSGGN
jgi:hypothetical protein